MVQQINVSASHRNANYSHIITITKMTKHIQNSPKGEESQMEEETKRQNNVHKTYSIVSRPAPDEAER